MAQEVSTDFFLGYLYRKEPVLQVVVELEEKHSREPSHILKI